ncbi:MAG: hypothetical protein BWX44_00450 [Spirochaetes bacterium ADurb.Bin001]|nr:MAG: hypothetical protein BWX44_00450 [Spirochaetes bacterium ADurb.Bin001]
MIIATRSRRLKAVAKSIYTLPMERPFNICAIKTCIFMLLDRLLLHLDHLRAEKKDLKEKWYLFQGHILCEHN